MNVCLKKLRMRVEESKERFQLKKKKKKARVGVYVYLHVKVNKMAVRKLLFTAIQQLYVCHYRRTTREKKKERCKDVFDRSACRYPSFLYEKGAPFNGEKHVCMCESFFFF